MSQRTTHPYSSLASSWTYSMGQCRQRRQKRTTIVDPLLTRIGALS
ncbi:hypothetical protein [Ktedonobacter racemifer]|nr:hypothetical protein [Ktedonobacter racemifer]